MLDYNHRSSVPSLAKRNEEMAPFLRMIHSRSSSALMSDDSRTDFCALKHTTRSLISLHRPQEAQKWPEESGKSPGNPNRLHIHTGVEKGKEGSGEDMLFRLFVTYRFSNIHGCYGEVD